MMIVNLVLSGVFGITFAALAICSFRSARVKHIVGGRLMTLGFLIGGVADLLLTGIVLSAGNQVSDSLASFTFLLRVCVFFGAIFAVVGFARFMDSLNTASPQ
jgi:hypothetical protein